jgi:hypothetical protein
VASDARLLLAAPANGAPGGTGVVAAGSSPRPAGADANWVARPSATGASSTQSAATRQAAATPSLRWRSRDGEPVQVTHSSSARRPAVVWREKHGAEEATGIIAVSYQQAEDPFSDPFRDRQPPADSVTRAAAELELTPAATTRAAEPSNESREPAMIFVPAATNLSAGTFQDAFNVDDPAPAPPMGNLDGTPRTVAPLTTEGASSGAACQRVYGNPGRNCCDEDRECRTALETLRDTPITKISLDITAPFMPDATTDAEELETRTGRIEKMPARIWRDRNGEVLADGKLVDVGFRKILIDQRNGRQTEIPLGKLSDDDLCFLAAWWKVPTECTLGNEMYAGRSWQPTTMTWKASAICHKPLYFEEVQLERYGHTMGPLFQPVVSGAHFFLNIAALPYNMGINPPNECQYTLGYYRPGSCAPWLLPPVPISLRGGLLQAGAVVGAVALFP